MSTVSLVLFLIVCGIVVVSASDETSCDDLGEHQCLFIEHRTIRSTRTRRRWFCLWLCTVEYTVYRTIRIPKCDCCPGWVMTDETTCTRCNPRRYGRGCEGECSCEANERCDPYGLCYCKPSFNGTACSVMMANCTKGDTRAECMEGNCNNRCINGEKCNHTIDQCDCPPQWRGKNCQYFSGCPDGLYGQECKQQCLCSNMSTCNGLNGECDCFAGWTGPTCDDQCQSGWYGINCSQSCNCPESSLGCDPVDGTCPCPAGFYGAKCSIECPAGFYGYNCQHECACNDSTSVCNKTTGECTVTAHEASSPAPNQEETRGGLSREATGVLVGLSLAAGVILLIVAIIVCRRRKNAQKNRLNGKTASTQIALATVVDASTGIRNEYDETEQSLYHVSGNKLSIYSEPTDVTKVPPRYINVGNTTNTGTFQANLATPDVSQDDYNCLDRSVVKPFNQGSKATEQGDYSAIQATPEPDGDYSHLDRGQRSPSMRSAENANYAATRPIDEQGGDYSGLTRGLKRPDEFSSNHGNQYESVPLND